MKKLSTWVLVMFMGAFGLLRLIIAVTSELGIDFAGIKPLNMQTEIILLFVVLLCLVFIIKRNIVGALIYLLSYGLYFGVDLYTNIVGIMSGGATLETSLNAFVSLIGIVIPIAVFFDLILDKNRKAHPVENKTDWFYQNEQYDREVDERADKNNYRTL